MESILQLDHVGQYNELMGVETLHPLVSVIDFSLCAPVRHSRRLLGFYAVFLKDVKCGDMRYGRRFYDYQEGTLVFVAPGQVAGVEDDGRPFRPRGWALLFHPDLLRGTPLARGMKGYTFFSYESDEALHLSEDERRTFLACLGNIRAELLRPADRHTRTLVVANIGLLLDYCARFYGRQFVTREEAHKDVLTRFERLLSDYFDGDGPAGLPTVQYFAERLHLSANYFGDLVKRETGRPPQEHIRRVLVGLAKERLLRPGATVGEVAYGLGFKYPQHFSRLFKKRVGCSPAEYRASGPLRLPSPE